MGSTRQELILPVDWDIIDACNGFTFDMGGSVMKIVFVDKKDWVAPGERKPGSKGNLHMVNFSRAEIPLALDFIRERVRMPERPGDGSMPFIYSTGVGGSQYAQQILDSLHVKNEQLMEFDCFNESFMHLVKNLPRKDVLHPVYKPAFEIMLKKIEMQTKIFEKLKGKSDVMDGMMEGMKTDVHFEQLKETDPEKPLISDTDLFPCGIMMCGSANGFSKLAADGTSTILRISCRGGKMMLGLGSLLTQTDTFEELMELCEKGNAFNVTQSQQSFAENMETVDDNDLYGSFAEVVDMMVEEEIGFCYGRAHGKRIGDFNKADLARCLLETHIYDLVGNAYYAAAMHELKHVFFCGGFVNHPLVRKSVTKQWVNHSQEYKMLQGTNMDVQIHFLVHAQSLGALGAMLNHGLKWSEKKKPPASGAATEAK